MLNFGRRVDDLSECYKSGALAAQLSHRDVAMPGVSCMRAIRYNPRGGQADDGRRKDRGGIFKI
jgi:hypothetical protein